MVRSDAHERRPERDALKKRISAIMLMESKLEHASLWITPINTTVGVQIIVAPRNDFKEEREGEAAARCVYHYDLYQ